MASLLDKLQVLDYEGEMILKRNLPPLNKYSFSIPSSNPNFQFFYFGNLVEWLVSNLGNFDFMIPGEFDDPNLVATNIVNVLKEIGLNLDLSALKLKSGHGENVLEVLETLANLVIQTKGIVFSKPIFKSDLKTQDAQVDQDAEIKTDNLDIDEKEWEEEEEEEEISKSFQGLELTIQEYIRTTLTQSTRTNSIQVNTQEWALEVERVAPLLKNIYSIESSRDWRIHLETMKFHFNKINLIQDSVLSLTARLSLDIEKSIEKIKSREKYLKSQFEQYSRQYKEISNSMGEYKQSFNDATRKVSDLTQELASVSEGLDITKSKMDEIGSGMTDSKPLINIKSAVLGLKSEIKTMDLRIGVMEHSLMQNKVIYYIL